MFSRHRNLVILTAILLAQLVLVGYQVHRNREIPLVREWAILVVTPIEKGISSVSNKTWRVWVDYLDLRRTRQENRDLARELNDVKLDNQRLQHTADEGKRLEALLEFKGQVPSQTVAARVIGSGGTETARLVMLDKGEESGLRPDMAVIVPDGVVGKVLRVYSRAAQVLLLTDSNSGVACLLESTRVHGILRGQNKTVGSLGYVLNDEKVPLGERVFTSGEDRIFPKGLPVGVVVEAHPGPSFQEITVQPFAKLDRLEEVLVITSKIDMDLPPPSAPGRTVADTLPTPPSNDRGSSPTADGGELAAAPPPPRPGPSAGTPTRNPAPSTPGPSATAAPPNGR